MNSKYFKKSWDETSGEELTDSWGISIFYFETDLNLNIIKQIQLFKNGKALKYDEHNSEDDYGFLSDQPLDISEFQDNEITNVEFYEFWEDNDNI